MIKDILTITHIYEDNIYKEQVAYVPFDAILYYYYDVYAEDNSREYYIVLKGSIKEISISEDEYYQVVKHFQNK